MLDGIELKGRCCVVALGIDTDGVKHPARALGRLDRERHRRDHAARQPRRARPGCRAGRARRHRRRQGAAQGRPRRLRRPHAGAALRPPQGAQRARSPARARPRRRPPPAARARGRSTTTTARSTGCACSPTSSTARHPGAAASLREGMEETLTVTRLGVRGRLKRTLASTNPCESMIETVRRTSRNVKRWQNGDMCLRWTAAGMLEAEQPVPQDHRLQRPRQARHRRRARRRRRTDARTPRPPRRPLRSPPPDHHTGTAVTKFHERAGHPRRQGFISLAVEEVDDGQTSEPTPNMRARSSLVRLPSRCMTRSASVASPQFRALRAEQLDSRDGSYAGPAGTTVASGAVDT